MSFKIVVTFRMPLNTNFVMVYGSYPLGAGRKLSVHKTFRRRPGRFLNVLRTFNLRPVSRG